MSEASKTMKRDDETDSWLVEPMYHFSCLLSVSSWKLPDFIYNVTSLSKVKSEVPTLPTIWTFLDVETNLSSVVSAKQTFNKPDPTISVLAAAGTRREKCKYLNSHRRLLPVKESVAPWETAHVSIWGAS